MSFTKERKETLYPRIVKTIKGYTEEFDQIPEARKKALKKLALFVEEKVNARENAELIFKCTHNSRRSHISQIWAQAAAAYYEIPNVICCSGGTEATAFNPRAVKAMEAVGFKITKTSEGTNPLYEVRYADDVTPVKAFSKKYDGEGNPKAGFAAVMTCSHADQNCPTVTGATVRLSIPYDDPKEFDGTAQEAAKYDERVHQIGREVLYAFSLVKT